MWLARACFLFSRNPPPPSSLSQEGKPNNNNGWNQIHNEAGGSLGVTLEIHQGAAKAEKLHQGTGETPLYP